MENEDVDLQTDPKFLEWKLEVKEDQKQMLEEFQTKCMNERIALPDQKSLINYLMAVFDGERVTARVKQFMCMIQSLTTDYMLNAFHRSQGKLSYVSRPTDQDTPPGDDKAARGTQHSMKSMNSQTKGGLADVKKDF